VGFLNSHLKNKSILICLCIFLASCQKVVEDSVPALVSVLDTDAYEEALDVSYILDERFSLDLWAPGPLLANAVAVSFDPLGNAYVTETYRRKSSDIDIRQHRDWMLEELSLETIEDTRNFHLQKLAIDRSPENTWLEDFNEDGSHDYRDLEIQSEVIKKIYDTDGDGRADASHVFADGFNSMLTGVAAGVLYHDGEVFLTAAPDLFKLKDTDGDGDADEREVISHGYGIHIAYAGHDMSGLTIGHDGKIYWSIGDMGLNVVDKTGKRWKYPNHGAVMRCNPDGSDFEVFAHGLRNPQELAFDAYGNLISVDNDGDHPGERERYVHILQGSDTGWRINWQYGKYREPYESYKVWMDEKLYLPYFEGQAAYITPALALAPNGPAGLAYNPGTGMNKDWNNTFFGSYFTGNKKNARITSFQLKPKGASYEIVNETDILVGINSTGLSFGPDGALYVNDWKDSYSKKDAGRIWKLDTQIKEDKRVETEAVLSEGADKLDIKSLDELLDHGDMRVRQMAQFELVKRNDAEALKNHAYNGKNLFGRLHAIWGFGQLMRLDPGIGSQLFDLLQSGDEHIKAQVAKVLGDTNFKYQSDKLIELLDDPSDRVRMHAIEALGKTSDVKALPMLVVKLEELDAKPDPHMRHTLSYAISKLVEPEVIAELSSHSSINVRLGAVLALRRQASDKVAVFLTDENKLVTAEAARAINDDFSIPAALDELARSLTSSPHKIEAFVRRAINANLRVGDAASADRLRAYFQNENNDKAMRKDALWALGYWMDPPLLDRVDNRYRELKAGDLQAAQNSIASIFAQVDNEPDAEIKSMIISVAGKLSYLDKDSKIYAFLKERNNAREVRIASLASLAQMKSSKLTEAIAYALDEEDIDLRREAQKILNQADLSDDAKLSLIDNILEKGILGEKQSAMITLSKILTPKGEERLTTLLQNFSTVEDGLKLDVLNAAEAFDSPSIKQLVDDYNSSKDQEDKLALYIEALYGGDEEEGKNTFIFNESAQCLRCHKVQGYGSDVGPALDNVGKDLSRKEILLSLIDPSSRIAPGYGNAMLSLSDGTEMVGSIASEEENSINIRIADGSIKNIDKSTIVSKENLPSGMFSQENILNKSEIRDLVAFLMTLDGNFQLQ